MVMKTLYDVLQVSRNADPETIKAARNSLVQHYHPEKTTNNPDVEKHLKDINRAYEILSDPAKRAGYDAALEEDDENQISQADASTLTDKTTPSPETNSVKNDTPVDDSAQASGNGVMDLYEATIGQRDKAYYLTKFKQFDQQDLYPQISWNWPAFFFGGTWALYRKMYGWFIAYWVISATVIVIDAVTFTIGKSDGSTVNTDFYPFALLQMVFFGVFANSFYHKNIKKKIAVAQLDMHDSPEILTHLQYKGGVHTWVVWVFSFVAIVGYLAFIIAIPTYHDYQKRAIAQQRQQSTTQETSYEDAIKNSSPQGSQPATIDPLGLYQNSSGSPQSQQSKSQDDLKPYEKRAWSGNIYDQFDSAVDIERRARRHDPRLNNPRAWDAVMAWQRWNNMT